MTSEDERRDQIRRMTEQQFEEQNRLLSEAFPADNEPDSIKAKTRAFILGVFSSAKQQMLEIIDRFRR